MALTQIPLTMLEGVAIAMRNRFINGTMKVDQRNSAAAQTFTAGAALAYCVDRWYGYCTGANVTGQRTTLADGTHRYRFTGAASNTGVGFAQRIEATNCVDMAGQTATLQVKLASSSLTTVNWQAYYASTTDTFGTLSSPTRTSIASGSFTINSTEATYSAQIAIPSAATTGIEIVFTGGALLGSQTLQIGDAQLELGATATPIERRMYSHEMMLCQRYCAKMGGDSTAHDLGVGLNSSTTNGRFLIDLPTQMRVAPSMTAVGGSANFSSTGTANFSGSAVSTGATSRNTATVDLTISGATAGVPAILRATATTAYLLFNAEL